MLILYSENDFSLGKFDTYYRLNIMGFLPWGKFDAYDRLKVTSILLWDSLMSMTG